MKKKSDMKRNEFDKNGANNSCFSFPSEFAKLYGSNESGSKNPGITFTKQLFLPILVTPFPRNPLTLTSYLICLTPSSTNLAFRVHTFNINTYLGHSNRTVLWK